MANSVVPSSGGNSYSLAGAEFSPQEWGAPPPPERASNNVAALLARTWSALKRYRWLILAIFAVGSATGVALTRFVKPKYGVAATIWIADAGGKGGPVQAPGLIQSDQGWTDLAKSFMVIDAVVRRLALHVTPASDNDAPLFAKLQASDSLMPGNYTLSVMDNRKRYALSRRSDVDGQPDQVIEKGAVGDSVGRAAGFLWQPTASDLRRTDSYDFTVVTPREAGVKIIQSLVVNVPMNSNLMQLRLTAEQPQRAAETLNQITRQFVNEATRLKKENLTQVANTIDDQLTTAASQLSAAENALESFKINTITQPNENVAVSPGVSLATNPMISSYFTEKGQLDNVRSTRQLLERIIAEGDGRGGKLSPEALRGAPGLLTVGPTGAELNQALVDLSTHQTTLRTLRDTYTDEHPRVRTELNAIATYEGQVIPSTARKLLAELRSSEAELDRRIAGASAELKKIPQRTIEELRRSREVTVRSTIYQDLQNRAVGSRLQERTVMPDVSIMDTAVAPLLPTSDTTLSLIAMAVLASLGAGIGVAILLDRLDSRFRYAEQAVNELGLDVVGAVPSYTAPRSQRQRLEQASQMVESFRSLALAVRSSFPAGQPLQVTISSPGPGDGKSTVSINLANALAEGGYRTLLVDGDIRRGVLHESCPPATQSPGLLDYLAGEATLGEIVKSTDLHANLSIIPCGTRRRQGPELLASQRTTLMLRELRSQFDAIVVDSAPLGAGIDAYALGSATGSMLLVLRVGETDRRLANSKLATLDRMPIRILGTVLNDIGESMEFRYYHYLDNYGGAETAPDVALIGSGQNGERK